MNVLPSQGGRIYHGGQPIGVEPLPQAIPDVHVEPAPLHEPSVHVDALPQVQPASAGAMPSVQVTPIPAEQPATTASGPAAKAGEAGQAAGAGRETAPHDTPAADNTSTAAITIVDAFARAVVPPRAAMTISSNCSAEPVGADHPVFAHVVERRPDTVEEHSLEPCR